MIRPGHTALLVLAIALAAGGCDTAIDPYTEGADTLVAMHGFLDSAADTQFVRLQVLRPTADGFRPVPPGVQVRSTGVENRLWRDSMATTEDGDPSTIFWAPFRPEPGVRYTLVVEYDGAVSGRAETVVPEVPVLIPGGATGDTGFYSKHLLLADVGGRVRSIDVWYEVIDPDTGQPVRVTISYGQPGQQVGDDWRFTVFLTRDRTEVQRRLDVTASDDPLRLVRTGIRVEVFSPEWGAGSSDPGVYLGHGFFASIGRWDVPYGLSGEEVVSAGFVDAQ